MLVLTRREGEEIVVDRRIVITVLRLGSGRVRLGIQAPDDVEILRREIEDAE